MKLLYLFIIHGCGISSLLALCAKSTRWRDGYLRVTPPIYVPRNVAVLTTFAEGSVAKVGNSWT
jgi:hypothetical protein